MFHTEAAFHPHRPRYLLLLCLRGDRDGCADDAVVDPRGSHPLPDDVRSTCWRSPASAPRRRVVPRRTLQPARSAGARAHRRARRAAHHLRRRPDGRHGSRRAAGARRPSPAAVAEHHTAVVLDAGDLLVVDNAARRARAHPVPARASTAPTAGCSGPSSSPTSPPAPANADGRVITTSFGDDAAVVVRACRRKPCRHAPDCADAAGSALPTVPQFASDNSAGGPPRACSSAFAAANEGHALAYGDDRVHARAPTALRRPVRPPRRRLLRVERHRRQRDGLATLLGPAEAVVCTDVVAHQRRRDRRRRSASLGIKLIDLPNAGRQAAPEHSSTASAPRIGVEHHAQPGVVSITQSTEIGTLYTADESAALCERAHASA